MKTGYGLFCIGHTKIRDINEKGSDEAYQQLTTSLSFDFDSVIADKADIIATISIDKEIIDIEEIGTDKKKVGSLGGITRWIHFRDDNFNVDCGGRFREIEDKVELSADNYIKAIEDAIKKASGKTDKEIKEKVKEEESQRKEAVKEMSEKANAVDEKANAKHVEYIKENIMSSKSKDEAVAMLKELGAKTIDDLVYKETSKVKAIVNVIKESN